MILPRSKLPKKWREIRAAVFARDGGKCLICGACTVSQRDEYLRLNAYSSTLAKYFLDDLCISRRNLHFWECDHIVRRADGGSHALENLRTLCVKCHLRVTKTQHGTIDAVRPVARDEEDEFVLDRRYGRNGHRSHTFAELASMLNVSADRARKILHRAERESRRIEDDRNTQRQAKAAPQAAGNNLHRR